MHKTKEKREELETPKTVEPGTVVKNEYKTLEMSTLDGVSL